MGLDIRLPIGIMFSLIGAVLVLYGIITNSRQDFYARSLDINVNLWWGLVLLVFGALMLLGALKGSKSDAPK